MVLKFFSSKTQGKLKEILHKGVNILVNWPQDDEGGKMRMIKRFYSNIVEERSKKQTERYDPIYPKLTDIEQQEVLFNTLKNELGDDGLRELIIYLLDNDNRYVNKDDLNNYKSHAPYPSYLIEFAYILLYILPVGFRNRKMFDSFWEHQAKIRPGLDEQFAKGFIKPFVVEGIITNEEIKELLIKDWLRWQRAPKNSLYYGASIGPSIWYVENYQWSNVVIRLENMWRRDTGKEPKKWGE